MWYTLSLIILLCLVTDDFACHKEGEHDHSSNGSKDMGKSLWVFKIGITDTLSVQNNPSFVNPFIL